MKKLLILLSLCVFVISCDNMQKPAMDAVGDMLTPPEDPFAGVPRITVSDAFMQDKITGPWLWMIAPTERGKGGAVSIDIDSLAVASNGAVTEMDVATNGAAEEDRVGDLTWTLGEIDDTDRGTDDYGNVNVVVNEIGLAAGPLDWYSSYALLSIVSDTDQSDVTMLVGSDDAIKVWLNGEVVHNNPINRPSTGFQDEFKIDLKTGNNLLLVKVSEHRGGWVMFVGLEEPSKLTPETETETETLSGPELWDTLPMLSDAFTENDGEVDPGLYRLNVSIISRGNSRLTALGRTISREGTNRVDIKCIFEPTPYDQALNEEGNLTLLYASNVDDFAVVRIVSGPDTKESKRGLVTEIRHEFKSELIAVKRKTGEYLTPVFE